MEVPIRRQEAKQAFLDLFAGLTGFHIGLYEMQQGQVRALYAGQTEPFCAMVHALPGGRELCTQDESTRARQGLEGVAPSLGGDDLRLCHAGLWNQTIQVRVGNTVRAVLSYGEMQIEDDEYREQTRERFGQLVGRLQLDDEQARQLHTLLVATKTYTWQQLEGLRKNLPKVKQWFYTLLDEEEQLRRNVEKVSHEIQTRLQAVLAEADNLAAEAEMLTQEDLRQRLNQLLYAALALDTVVQNLESEYLEEYQFRRQSLLPLLIKARNLYEAEARRRGIEIHISLHPDAGVVISEHHIQLALNNLMHNAIKYSFRSGPGRQRYVRITGRADGRFYRLSFENYGVGMLPEELTSGIIFEDGYQGKLTQGEYRTGSGKGLYFVKRVIDCHHGGIHVESEMMADRQDPEGQPHLNRFVLYLPYEQPRG